MMRLPIVAAAAAGLAGGAAAAAAAWSDVGAGGYTTRSDCAFSTCGSKLCLLGGRNGAGDAVKPASVYDTSAGAWADVGAAPVGVHHFQAAADPEDEDCVWAGGAFQGPFPAEDLVDKVYKFCPGSGEWSEGPQIDRPRGSGGAVTYDGKYYLVGGNVGGHGEQAEVKAWFDVYDPKTGKWSELPDIPNPRDHFAAAVLDGKLYVAGGRDSGVAEFFDATEDTVDVYDFGDGKWSTLDAKYPAPAGGTLAATHGDVIVYGGGEGGGTATDEVFLFDGAKFTAAPPMLTPRHGTFFASCSGALWLAGGVSKQGGEPEVGTTEALHDSGERSPPACSAAGVGSPGVTKASLLGEEDAESGESSSGSGASDSAGSDGEDGGDDETKKCFPAAATVQLESGGVVAMEDLKIGDRVRVSAGGYSDVYFFSHRDADVRSHFIVIGVDGGASLALTSGHLLRVNGALAPARAVAIGDNVDLAPASGVARAGRVISVTRGARAGLYNPHTVHGEVVVDGVVTSCRTDALDEPAAAALLAPFRALYAAAGAGALVGGVNDVALNAIRAGTALVEHGRYVSDKALEVIHAVKVLAEQGARMRSQMEL